MSLEVGSILEGKVTGITKFGAFVALAEGKSGMVHISEVATTFVSNIQDFISEGQEVRVKVIGIDEVGRINLSIKKALEPTVNNEQRQQRGQQSGGNQRFQNRAPRERRYAGGANSGRAQGAQPREVTSLTFEDKLKAFMSDSESRQADVRHSTDRKNGSRRRK